VDHFPPLLFLFFALQVEVDFPIKHFTYANVERQLGQEEGEDAREEPAESTSKPRGLVFRLLPSLDKWIWSDTSACKKSSSPRQVWAAIALRIRGSVGCDTEVFI
jgi:hypothetical protein